MTHTLHKQKIMKLIIYQSKSKWLFTCTLAMAYQDCICFCVRLLQTYIQPKEVTEYFYSANEIQYEYQNH